MLLGSMFKSRDITLPAKVHIVKAMVFPVVTYGCESWITKKSESQRIDAFELWCWRRLLRVPWTARRSSQSILKEINPEQSLKGLMVKLKLQYLGQLMQRAASLEKTLMLEKIEGKRKRGRQRMREIDSIIKLDSITISVDMSLSKRQEIVKDRGAWCVAVHGAAESGTIQLLSNKGPVVQQSRHLLPPMGRTLKVTQGEMKIFLIPYCAFKCNSTESTKEDFLLTC